MLHQLKVWSAVALTAVLTCIPLAVAGDNGDPMTITRFTQDSVITDQHLTNDCNGEDVLLNGTMHFELVTGSDADGDRTLFDTTTRLVGEGQTTCTLHRGG